MKTQEIRRRFLDYFKKQGHTVVPSSPVVPHDDPTLLFINAGMNQFKDVFLGQTARDYTRATSSQKCIRVGGKHNDLENVGHTSRHLTFFEMMGNFSFGDYFKKEAIQYAWEVSTEIFGFAPERIWPSVFRDDDEAFELWTAYVPAERITRFGEEDNFWMMGDTGPCGPCTELYLDRGSDYGDAPTPLEDTDGERFYEFWNLVFMQSNRDRDGNQTPLPKPSIDTGAGLERIIALQMGAKSVFETDVLRGLISRVEEISGRSYDINDTKMGPAFHVIADHLRCLAFSIADGVQPSNVERGYVLRKVLRRAVRYARTLGMEKPFLAQVFPHLLETMGPDYPELKTSANLIEEILTTEEEAFIRTLRRGGNMLSQIIDHAHRHGHTISGDDAFKLKDTYGFPLEEVVLIANDANLVVDLDRYENLEKEARERSKRVHKTTEQIASESIFEGVEKSAFTGYKETLGKGTVTALVVNGEFVDSVNAGTEAMVVLDKTPFYAEMGGQIGDLGELSAEGIHFHISDCQAPFKGVTAHVGTLKEGTLMIGQKLMAIVDFARRQRIANNHTATHLLHWALHHVLGEHIRQAGSVVAPDRLRFDFSHHKALTQEEIDAIEDLVNAKIRDNTPVKNYELDYEEAQQDTGIKQFFGEKYGKRVRVIDIDFSKELCGGTHTSALGNIGLFRIAKEGSIAAGIRRIEAVTGPEAEQLARQGDVELREIADELKTVPQKLRGRLQKLLEENKQLTQEVKASKGSQRKDLVTALKAQVEEFSGVPCLITEVKLPSKELQECAEEVMSQLPSLVVILAASEPEKCQLLIRVTDDWIAKGIRANELIKKLAPIIQGGGGGKANQAQAGGKAPQHIAEALAAAKELITQHS